MAVFQLPATALIGYFISPTTPIYSYAFPKIATTARAENQIFKPDENAQIIQ